MRWHTPMASSPPGSSARPRSGCPGCVLHVRASAGGYSATASTIARACSGARGATYVAAPIASASVTPRTLPQMQRASQKRA